MARQRRLWCCRRLPRPQAVRCPRQSRQDAPASETRVAARRRSVLKYRTHPNLTSTKSQDVPAESVEIWFRRMSAWAAGRDQCIYSGGRRLVERTGHRQGHCLERSKPLIETLFSQKLGPLVCTKVCAFRILSASETQCTCGFRWAEAKSHPFRQYLEKNPLRRVFSFQLLIKEMPFQSSDEVHLPPVPSTTAREWRRCHDFPHSAG